MMLAILCDKSIIDEGQKSIAMHLMNNFKLFAKVVVLNLYLSQRKSSGSNATDQEISLALCGWIAESILPSPISAERNPYSNSKLSQFEGAIT